MASSTSQKEELESQQVEGCDGGSLADSNVEEKESSYDLLCDDDPEDFVSIEPPTDTSVSDNTVPPYQEGGRKRVFQLLGKRSPDEKKMTTPPDISQLSLESHDDEAVEAALSSPQHTAVPAGGGAGVTGIDPALDASLRSDMLVSLAPASFSEMQSVRQSLHIGVGPSDLRLPSDEEITKKAASVRRDSVESDLREFEDEDVESATWSQHEKHVFVLSISGKPVYSRYGKEDKLVNLFGIMQALVSFVQDDKDSLRTIVAGDRRIVFVCRGPLVLVSVAKTQQSETQLALQLMYTYYQILSVLTHTQLQQIFDHNPGFDLRYLLQGSEKFVDNILNMLDTDPSFILSGIRCLAMPVQLRQTVTSTLMQCRTKEVLFAVMIADNKLITYIKPKEHNLSPTDIHLIMNLVDASTSFRSAESWTPICLPKFNDTGFLHAHVSYLPGDSPACLLLISTDKEKFFALQECQMRIVEKLEKLGCVEAIKTAVHESPYSIDSLQAPDIRHYIYKSRKSLCITSPKIPDIYSDKQDQDRLFELYMLMHQKLHSKMWPIKILYHVGDKEALLGWRTAGFDLYAVFDPLIAKSQAILLGNKLIRWINKEEDRLILTSSQTF